MNPQQRAAALRLADLLDASRVSVPRLHCHEAATLLRELAHTKVPLYDGDQMQEYAEAVATKWVMRAGAQEALADHFKAALKEIAGHDYGRLRPTFDPQAVAMDALKKAAGLKRHNVNSATPPVR